MEEMLLPKNRFVAMCPFHLMVGNTTIQFHRTSLFLFIHYICWRK